MNDFEVAVGAAAQDAVVEGVKRIVACRRKMMGS